MSKFTEHLAALKAWMNATPELKKNLLSDNEAAEDADEGDDEITTKLDIFAGGCEHKPVFIIRQDRVISDGGENEQQLHDSVSLSIDQLREALAFAEDCLKD